MKRFKKLKLTSLDPDEILADSVSILGESGGAEGKIERPLERFYSFVFLAAVAGGIFYLLFRGGWLGLKEGDAFLLKSQENRFSVRNIFPARGVIYDRYGEAMVENVPTFGLVFEKREFLNKGGDLANLLGGIGAFLQKPPEYFFELGFPADYSSKNLPSRILMSENLTLPQAVSLTSRLDDLPGVQIFEGYRRIYKNSLADSHAVGFVGKVSEDDLRKNPGLLYEDSIGKSGIEGFYDDILRGKSGRKIIEIDSKGEETRFRLTEEPEDGQTVVLNIDGELQKTAYDTVNGYTGRAKGASVVAIDPRNGAVLALVSFPGFNSNKFGTSLTDKEFSEVLSDSLKPMFNRAISGEFPSGSTIKPMIAAAALEEDIIDPQKAIYDEGFISIPNPYNPDEKSVFVDWKKHGWVNFYDAIAVSANVYFYMIGGGYKDQEGLGIDRIKKYAGLFGLGAKLGIDIPGEKSGFIPDPESKKISEPDDPIWRIGDTYNVSIGQGGVRVTPLQMVSLASAIANGGTLYEPHVLKSIMDRDGNITKEVVPKIIRNEFISKDSLFHVVKGMRQAVTRGVAGRLADLPVAVAAKTGTAQIGKNQLPHAWVMAFAPVENPEIAVVVMVEHAGEGSTVAVPIMREILKWYFENKR